MLYGIADLAKVKNPLEIDYGDFDSFLYSKMNETKLPSLTCAILKDGKIVHTRAFGPKSIETGVATTVKTNYCIGSVTKSFAALGIGILVQDGRVDFHDPLTKYLPSLQKYKAFDHVEIHHLLAHSSGIPGLGSAEVLIFNAIGISKKWFPSITNDDLVSFMDQVDDWVVTEPGKRYFYLNEGYHLIGEIISKASGMDYTRFIKSKIFDPLEMHRTFFSKEEVDQDQNYATPYLIKDGRATPSIIPWGAGAAGGIMSNVLDLSNYLEMYLCEGEFRGRKIVDKDIVKKMETPHSKPPASLFTEYGYGYGLLVTSNFFGQKLVRHDGSMGVYTSSVAFLPNSNVGISILTNAEGYSPSLLSLYGLLTVMGKNPKDFAPFKHELLLQKLAGNYSAYKGTVVAEVKRNGDFLILSGEDIGEQIILVPEESSSEGAIFYTQKSTAKLIVEFTFDESGSVEMIYERYRYRKT